jgi:hypothetical protein
VLQIHDEFTKCFGPLAGGSVSGMCAGFTIGKALPSPTDDPSPQSRILLNSGIGFRATVVSE